MKIFEITYVVTIDNTEFEDKILVPATTKDSAKELLFELTSKSKGIISMQIPDHRLLLPLGDKGRLKITHAEETSFKTPKVKAAKKGAE